MMRHVALRAVQAICAATGPGWRIWPVVFTALLLAGLGTRSAAAQPSCALSLVLAIDFSSSIDSEESDLQLRGLARALASDPVRNAIKQVGGIQIHAFEWSGRNQQVQIAPWEFIDTDASVVAFAQKLIGHQRAHDDFPTALGHAVGHAAIELGRAPRQCARRVIDVSGDGVNNEGFDTPSAYRHFPFEGVIVNGLVIAGAWPDPVVYYRSRVKRGPGAFVEVAESFRDYEDAMKRKLLREILGNAFSGLGHKQAVGPFASVHIWNQD